jgi:hypothetical protein
VIIWNDKILVRRRIKRDFVRLMLRCFSGIDSAKCGLQRPDGPAYLFGDYNESE